MGNGVIDLKQYIVDVPGFPKPGIVFRDIAPLLRHHFGAVVDAMGALVRPDEWQQVDAVAGIESRGFVLAAALAARHSKGLVMARKKGKLPPPTVRASYDLEYGSDALEMKQGDGRVLLVDDVFATGGTMRASADLCRTAGYDVIALLVLLDLNLNAHFEWNLLKIRPVIRYD